MTQLSMLYTSYTNKVQQYHCKVCSQIQDLGNYLRNHLTYLTRQKGEREGKNTATGMLVSILRISSPPKILSVVWGFINCPPNIIQERLRCPRRMLVYYSRTAPLRSCRCSYPWRARRSSWSGSHRLVQVTNE